jgi:hypothetical protein
MDLHDLLKLYKHGYSKVTDHATREIRFGRLTRTQGIALVRRHEQQLPQYEQQFCNWLGLKPRGLHFVMNQHRNKKFWQESEPGRFDFKGWSSSQEQATDIATPDAFFKANTPMESPDEARYITVGKGWPS